MSNKFISRRGLLAARAKLRYIREHSLFEPVVTLVIIICALTIGAKTYSELWVYKYVFYTLDFLITLFFVVEMVVRIFSERRWYDFFKEPGNVFAFVIVFVSLIPFSYLDTVLLGRLARVFRVLRLFVAIPELKLLITALSKAPTKISHIFLFMFVGFYIYGAVGCVLFKKIDPEHWSNIAVSMFTLFQVATLDGWTDIYFNLKEHYDLVWLYFLSFIIINTYIFLNMIIGIIVETMRRESIRSEIESGEGGAADIQKILLQLDFVSNQLDKVEKKIEKIQDR